MDLKSLLLVVSGTFLAVAAWFDVLYNVALGATWEGTDVLRNPSC